MTEEHIDGTGEGGNAINKVLNRIAEAAGLGSSESEDAAGDDSAADDPERRSGAAADTAEGR